MTCCVCQTAKTEPALVFNVALQRSAAIAKGSIGAEQLRYYCSCRRAVFLAVRSAAGQLRRQATANAPLIVQLDLIEVHRQTGIPSAELSQLLQVVTNHSQLGDTTIEVTALIQCRERLVDGITEQQCPINGQPLSCRKAIGVHGKLLRHVLQRDSIDPLRSADRQSSPGRWLAGRK